MTGQALKEEGMDLATLNKGDLLERARQIALTKARQNGTVTADDIPGRLREALGPAAGSVFRTSDFEFTGKRITSVLVSNHARELKVWKLTDAGATKATVHTGLDRVDQPPISAPTPLPDWLS